MSAAVEIALHRVIQPNEEGFRAYPYDDATSLRVRAPKGHITWLYGCDLDTEGTPALGVVVARFKLETLEQSLAPRDWFAGANDPRKSVFLDIAFNQGLHGLLDYPSMIHYASLGDWVNAAVQCSVKPDSLPGVVARYKRLSDILLSGVDTSWAPS